MITLVSCGHTLGGVRSLDFPQLVPPNSDASLPNFALFDGTSEFDNAVVTQYLDGTTLNPLVVGPNSTMASDLRIFASDGNQTMQSLASSSSFSEACAGVLQRMLNTVPRDVTLTEEITLLPVKVYNVGLTIDRQKLVFKVSLRLTKEFGKPANKDRNVTMFWCDRHGDNKDCAGTTKYAKPSGKTQDDFNVSPITSRMGLSLVSYHFVVPIEPGQSLAKFWFKVDEKDGTEPAIHDNGGDGYQLVQDNILFVPGLSHFDLLTEPTRVTYTIVAAVRNDLNPNRVYIGAFDSAIRGQPPPPPLNVVVDLVLDSAIAPVEGYTFYSGMVNEDPGSQLTIDLHCEIEGTTYSEDFKPTFFLDNFSSSPPTPVGIVDSREIQQSAAAYSIVTWTWTRTRILVGSLLLWNILI
jgi:hypothetical protein